MHGHEQCCDRHEPGHRSRGMAKAMVKMCMRNVNSSWHHSLDQQDRHRNRKCPSSVYPALHVNSTNRALPTHSQFEAPLMHTLSIAALYLSQKSCTIKLDDWRRLTCRYACADLSYIVDGQQLAAATLKVERDMKSYNTLSRTKCAAYKTHDSVKDHGQ